MTLVPSKPQKTRKLPGKLRIIQTHAFNSGMYFTDPADVLNFGESASLGTGIITSTWFAIDCRLNCDLACKHQYHGDKLYISYAVPTQFKF